MSSCMCLSAMATVFSPAKGTVPVSISYIIMAQEYMSLSAVTSSPFACSGEI